jgi:hypothetical protein
MRTGYERKARLFLGTPLRLAGAGNLPLSKHPFGLGWLRACVADVGTCLTTSSSAALQQSGGPCNHGGLGKPIQVRLIFQRHRITKVVRGVPRRPREA